MWQEKKIKDFNKLKKYLEKPEIQKLINENEFGRIYAEWETKSYPTSCNMVRALTITFINANINFMEHIVKIPAFCFDNLDIEEIIIPNNIDTIDRCAFYNCEQLISVKIPTSVKYIGDNLFTRCKNLKRVHYEGTKKEWMEIKSLYPHLPSFNDSFWGRLEVVCKDGVWRRITL